jgi:hypothetical protein
LTQAPTDAVATMSPSAHTGTGRLFMAFLYLVAFHLDLCLGTAHSIRLKSLKSAKLEYPPTLITRHCSAEYLGKQNREETAGMVLNLIITVRVRYLL